MKQQKNKFLSRSNGLSDPTIGRDACGMGFIASVHNKSSREIVLKGFEALRNLTHRGAVDADGKTGDGAGILTSIPHEFYRKKAQEQSVDLSHFKNFAVMMIFFPTEKSEELACRKIVNSILKKYDVEILWSRDLPVNKAVLGQKALSVKPMIRQKFLACPPYMIQDEFEQFLFFIRKEIEIIAQDHSYNDFYIPSMSSRTIVHKGLFVGDEVCHFYKDLQDPDFISEFVVFHQRFSTNTFPSWPLAHPFRMLAHNGEINTIRGNRFWMKAREIADQPRSWVPGDHGLSQIMMAGRSDSGSFDNALEAYVFGGRSILHALIHMMPEPWQNQKNMDEDLRAFYEYHACLAEHWGGPAAMSFSDGKVVGTIVDRNGLRPARYKITKEYLFVCSEMGCVHFDEKDVLETGKLSPGKIIAINLKRKKILKNSDIKYSLADQGPYKEWLDKRLIKIEHVVSKKSKSIYHQEPEFKQDRARKLKKAFGYTEEDLSLVLHPMIRTGQESLGAMGDDTPLSVLSKKPKLLYTYFKQLFAQVTNPPIDPIRERFGTSLRMYLGKSGNVYEETQLHAQLIRVRTPVVTKTVFDEIISHPDFPCAILSTEFSVAEGPGAIEDTLSGLRMAAEKAVDDGKVLLILSDKYIDKKHAPIPMLLAVAAVHHHLVRTGKRMQISLLVETGEARETHHFACLIGYGASVIYPYLALHEALELAQNSKSGLTHEQAVENYIHAVEKGLLKIMAKMGISVLQSYHAAQIFEVIGLKSSVVREYFEGTPSKISGIDLIDIASDYLKLHQDAFAKDSSETLDIGGHYRFRRDGERHAFHPEMIQALHQAVKHNDTEAYHEFARLVNEREPLNLRDLMSFKKRKSIPLSEVEDVEKIVQRFCTPGISYGAISKETHEDFAIAMNRIHAKSNSGEGGEDPDRYAKMENGDSKHSAIKQVASGRFGVTIHYLSQAKELEIKIAQGAKPGEGGQLPGHKVSQSIAMVRHSTPGVTLISPPPHHDIYSIEDLAQLIYDLKQANPKARVCVKLVAEDGVGTIAAGVAKAHADIILISGYDGGTGASPLSSIKNAGLPWELGLSETQQVLVHNRLRERVTLRVDGGLKTGLDVVKAAIMGAEEFGFGTASMVALGCVMVRQCHRNTCPVGIATQDPNLRAKYSGTPERLIHYFYFVASEVREILAELGAKSLNEIIGRVDLLEQVRSKGTDRTKKLNFKRILMLSDTKESESLHHQMERNDWINDVPFDDQMVRDCQDILETGEGEKKLNYLVRNVHRSIGTRLSYEIVSRYGPKGFPHGKIVVHLQGTSGQSFGAFAMDTLELHLKGEANDYVGKGLSGALLSLTRPLGASYRAEENIICGNTCLYGATSGKLFVNGRSGERFAVRNSGSHAVVEGVGDHGCEYMTGGSVLILGRVGNNFGAGMTGGMACVYDANDTFRQYCNLDDIELFEMDWNSESGVHFLSLLKEHVKHTSSELAKMILGNWSKENKKFVFVMPKECLRKF